MTTTLTIEFKGVPEVVLSTLVKKGYTRTKAEEYAYQEIRNAYKRIHSSTLLV